MNVLSGAIEIITSPYAPEFLPQNPPPFKRGPYLRRRAKRWYKAHPRKPAFLTLPQGKVLCHPNNFALLMQVLTNSGVIVR